MRIISDFKDYYDCVQRMGQDLSLVWERETSEWREWRWPIKTKAPRWSHWRLQSGTREFAPEIIGFCGEFYPVAIAGCNLFANKVVLHSIEEVDAYVEKYEVKRNQVPYYKNNRDTWLEFFKFGENETWSFGDEFGSLGVPLFRITYSGLFNWRRREYRAMLQTNCCLNDVEFFKRVDTYQAFQRIQAWLGNIASPPPVIPHVSDADMLECKGFDPKTSFRMASPGKKRKKKKDK